MITIHSFQFLLRVPGAFLCASLVLDIPGYPHGYLYDRSLCDGSIKLAHPDDHRIVVLPADEPACF